MTADEAVAELVAAAEKVADWYRRGGDTNTAHYRDLMSNLARWVQVYRQTTQEEP